MIVLYPRGCCEVKLMLAKPTEQCRDLVSKCPVKYELPRSLRGSPIQQVRGEPSAPGTVHEVFPCPLALRYTPLDEPPHPPRISPSRGMKPRVQGHPARKRLSGKDGSPACLTSACRVGSALLGWVKGGTRESNTVKLALERACKGEANFRQRRMAAKT